MLVSLVLPPFLVHRLSAAEYSAWVLILQLSTYVNLLDFGLQTAIGKFVAEHDAAGDRESSHLLVSTSFTLLAGAALIAAAGILVLAQRVPQLFHQMPPALVPEVRLGVIVLGLSTAFALPFNAFASVFNGLQQYTFPTLVAIISRFGSATALIVVLLLHGGLVQMACVLSVSTVGSGVAQFLGWRSYARKRVDFTFFLYRRDFALRLAKYGGVLSVWTVAMLLVSGLDNVIVGHYDFKNTGFYNIASSVTNVMLALITSVFGPMVPALSSMQAGSTPARLGELCIRITRYCNLLTWPLGLLLVFGAYPLLSLWVGGSYAAGSATYARILVMGNVVRQFGYGYTLAVVATGKQYLATAAAIAEATVNISLSIWLVQRFGAVGVAVGTLAGAFISVGMHLAFSMHWTQSTILIQRRRFLLDGLLRPMLCVLPSALLYPFWKPSAMVPANPALLTLWLALTATIIWTVGLRQEERRECRSVATRLVYLRRT
jgi:O-antigen/teichoic acid export membrane protein